MVGVNKHLNKEIIRNKEGKNEKEGRKHRRKIELFPQFSPYVLITAFVCCTAVGLGNFVSRSAMEQEHTGWGSPKAPVAATSTV